MSLVLSILLLFKGRVKMCFSAQSLNYKISRTCKVYCVDPSQYRSPQPYHTPQPYQSPKDYSTLSKGIIQPIPKEVNQIESASSGYGAPKSYSTPLNYSSPKSYSIPSYAFENGDGGNTGGNDGGSGGGGGSEGDSGDESSGFVRPLTLMYAVAIAGGGLAGYVRKRSKYSLIAGLVFASVLFICWFNMPAKLYTKLALGASIILCSYMANKYLKSEDRKFMPTGMIATMSGFMSLTYLLNGAI
eukprot:TRINITY_DN18516_c0_g1_i2.p3 TRINITY_DN18516_c0_g1~~TRINITY_DN18516_c0_g1_i2.p3  ORF type:complete len:244 (+),score=38.00 TRINITY_DN18516_c0_g1_i2:17-748(+)